MTCELRSRKVSAAKSDLMPRITGMRGEDNIFQARSVIFRTANVSLARERRLEFSSAC